MPAGVAERLELLEPGQLGDVDLAGKVRPDGALEVEPRLEIAAWQRPGALEGTARPLPEEDGEPPVADLEDDGERDMSGGGPSGPPLRPGAPGGLLRPAAPGFRLRVGDRGILPGHRFSIIGQKLAL
jgi:hypothetical protein